MVDARQQLIIIPTFNEKENLSRLLAGVTQYVESHILFVDDNSSDGTREEITKICQSKPERFFSLFRPGKMGLATAYLDGFAWAMEKGYESIIQMDADLSHQPKYLPEFFAALENYDVVLGSRYVAGGGVENWSLKRKLLSRGGGIYARTVLGVPIQDFTGGFNGWRIHSLQRIGLDSIKSRGYCFQIEMKYRAARLGLRYKEVPIVFPDRVAGKSKMSFKIMAEALLKVWVIRLGL